VSFCGGFTTKVMSKRTFACIVIVFLGIVAGAGILWAVFGTSRISIAESDIQALLARQLPKTVNEVTIERVAVQLADSRLGLRIELHGKVLGESISAAVSARGAPRYDVKAGEVFFDADDVSFARLIIGSKTVIGEGDSPAGVAEATSSTIQRLVEAAIKIYLATQPVYRFSDDLMGTVLQAALADVSIQQDKLVITLSVWHLAAMVAIFGLVCIVVVYLIALVRRRR